MVSICQNPVARISAVIPDSLPCDSCALVIWCSHWLFGARVSVRHTYSTIQLRI